MDAQHCDKADGHAPAERARRRRTDAGALALGAPSAVVIAALVFALGLLLAGRGLAPSLLFFLAQDVAGAVVLCGAWIVVRPLSGGERFPVWSALRPDAAPTRDATILALAFLAGAGAMALRVLVHHGYDPSADEFLSRFQALIFLEGRLAAPLPAPLAPLAEALRPHFAFIDPERALWFSDYRPVHAMLRAAAMALGSDAALNGLTAAVSAGAIALLARRLFPAQPGAPLLAAALLMLSPQFVATSASGYAFPAHLAFNLVWLLLFLRGGWAGHLGALAVGMLAIGLHQVHVHPLFALPFLAALTFGHYGDRCFAPLYLVGYGLAGLFWAAWPEIAIWLETGDAGALPSGLLDLHYLRNYLEAQPGIESREGPFPAALTTGNLLRFLLWLSPAVLLLGALGLARWRALPLTVRLGVAGVALTTLAHAVLMPYQTQGWGYRYLHPVLGSVVLLAVAGAGALPRLAEGARLARAAGVLALASALALLPLRLWQVDRVVGPRAAVAERIAASGADLVLLDIGERVWFSDDFVANGPFLDGRPVVLRQDSPAVPATRRALGLESTETLRLDGTGAFGFDLRVCPGRGCESGARGT